MHFADSIPFSLLLALSQDLRVAIVPLKVYNNSHGSRILLRLVNSRILFHLLLGYFTSSVWWETFSLFKDTYLGWQCVLERVTPFSAFLFLRALASIKRIPPKVPSYLPNTITWVVKNFSIRSLRAVWERHSDHRVDTAIKNVMSLF